MLFAVIYCTGTWRRDHRHSLQYCPGKCTDSIRRLSDDPQGSSPESSWCSGAVLGHRWCGLGAGDDGRNRTSGELGHPQHRPPGDFRAGVLRPCRRLIGWRADHLERLDVGSSRSSVATIGQDPVGGINRYNFGFTDLAAGIAFVPAILGFFAVSEIFVQAEKKASGQYDAPKVGMSFPTVMEIWMHKFAVIRSILVGFACRILPGIGATPLAAFMGYGEAVRWSKNKEEFGKGKLEGVISSETANNAATGAAMIPLLAWAFQWR